VADKLMDLAPENEEVVEQRVDMVFEIFKAVMQRPRIKPLFDRAHPEAHVQKKSNNEVTTVSSHSIVSLRGMKNKKI